MAVDEILNKKPYIEDDKHQIDINRKYVVFDHVIVDINGTDEYDSNSGGSKENIEISRHYNKDIELSVMVVGYFNQDKAAIIEDIENNNTTTIGTSNMTACTVLRQASGIHWSVNPGTWGYYGLVQTLPIKIEFTQNYGHCSIDLNWNSANYYGSVSVYVRSIYL